MPVPGHEDRGYAIDGPLAAAFGPSAVFAVGAAYGLLSSAAVLTLRSVRAVRWHDHDEPAPTEACAAEPAPAEACAAEPAPEVSASSPPREGRRRRPAAPPP